MGSGRSFGCIGGRAGLRRACPGLCGIWEVDSEAPAWRGPMREVGPRWLWTTHAMERREQKSGQRRARGRSSGRGTYGTGWRVFGLCGPSACEKPFRTQGKQLRTCRIGGGPELGGWFWSLELSAAGVGFRSYGTRYGSGFQWPVRAELEEAAPVEIRFGIGAISRGTSVWGPKPPGSFRWLDVLPARCMQACWSWGSRRTSRESDSWRFDGRAKNCGCIRALPKENGRCGSKSETKAFGREFRT